MKIEGKSIIITGAANGIGAALAKRFSADGAECVILADLDYSKAESVADAIRSDGGTARAARCDVSKEADLQALVDLAMEQCGRVDLFCSNAGVMITGDPMSEDGDWQQAWDVNVMAHVHAARAVLPQMLKRGSGYLLNTCSAAGMLTSLGAAPYAVSKHAAVAFAEWLAITYGPKGIGVSALCPMVVRTKMIEDAIASGAGDAVSSGGTMMDPAQVADQVVDALEQEQFLILTHPETQTFAERKAANVDRWITGMQKFAASQE